MGGLLLYPHSLLQFPSFSAFNPPRVGLFNLAEIADRSFVLSVKANGGRHKKNHPSDDNARSLDAKSSLSPNKEEILALFKRIQSSISKGGETVTSKKRTSRAAAEDHKPSSSPSAESILQVLHQSRTQRKGKSVGKKGDKFLDTQKESLKKEESAEHFSTTRPPSRFTRRSPIPSLSSPREELPSENETIPETPTPSIPRDEIEVKNDTLPSTDEAMKLAEMKLPQLKEVAKSKGIKGYSKLKKSELVELLIKSLNDASP
ncbi:hypothetical protein C2S52_003501 [Perilla frutescens var. hirtella]|nr:hypothetical protein C2S51_012006 [Perilla frutescens var. frutescens]KAH6793024.1 hypothetical protein C2S52_003501 [Perilla frutescens var. hirtella]